MTRNSEAVNTAPYLDLEGAEDKDPPRSSCLTSCLDHYLVGLWIVLLVFAYLAFIFASYMTYDVTWLPIARFTILGLFLADRLLFLYAFTLGGFFRRPGEVWDTIVVLIAIASDIISLFVNPKVDTESNYVHIGIFQIIPLVIATRLWRLPALYLSIRTPSPLLKERLFDDNQRPLHIITNQANDGEIRQLQQALQQEQGRSAALRRDIDILREERDRLLVSTISSASVKKREKRDQLSKHHQLLEEQFKQKEEALSLHYLALDTDLRNREESLNTREREFARTCQDVLKREGQLIIKEEALQALQDETSAREEKSERQQTENILKNQQLTEQERQISLRGQRHQEREEELREWEQQLQEQEREQRARVQRLQEQERELVVRGQQIHEQDREQELHRHELEVRSRGLSVREEELKNRQELVVRTEQDLDRRQRYLESKEESLSSRELALEARQAELEDYQRSLNLTESEIETLRQQVSDLEAQVEELRENDQSEQMVLTQRKLKEERDSRVHIEGLLREATHRAEDLASQVEALQIAIENLSANSSSSSSSSLSSPRLSDVDPSQVNVATQEAVEKNETRTERNTETQTQTQRERQAEVVQSKPSVLVRNDSVKLWEQISSDPFSTQEPDSSLSSSSSFSSSPSSSRLPLDNRSRVANEIYETEKNYVRYLSIMGELFHGPLVKAVDEKPILSATEIKTLFSELPVICGFHQFLLNKLETLMKSWDSATSLMGEIFLDIDTYVKGYNQYVANYPIAIALYEQLITSNPAFAQFLNKPERTAPLKGLTILDCLIMPIQRIPRYMLLLKELLKNTPQGHPDHPLIEKAISKVGETAVNINNVGRLAENQSKIFSLFRMIQGYPDELLIPSRAYVREGKLIIYETWKNQSRYYFLFNDVLIETTKKMHIPLTTRTGKKGSRLGLAGTTKGSHISTNKYSFKRQFSLRELTVMPVPDTPGAYSNAWRFTSKTAVGSSSFIVMAASPEEKEGWLGDLEKYIKEQSSKANTLRKSFSSQTIVDRKPQSTSTAKERSTISRTLKMSKSTLLN